jgi:DNA-binding beta-propeller fold protein YncE
MRSSVGCMFKSGLSLLLALAASSGCSLGQSGIKPPNDQIFLPSGLAVDPAGDWLYVVNSNNDLRFNAGTLLPLDLAKAKQHRDRGTAGWPPCGTTYFEGDEDPAALAEDPNNPCCVDLVNPHIINCNGRAYAQADATVEIGSFGAATAIQQQHMPSDVAYRLFIAVRADPSVTFMDVRRPLGADGLQGPPQLRCTGPRASTEPQSRNAFCSDDWRVRRPSGADVEDNVLPEEPHSLTLDETLGILYVGHLAVTVRGSSQGGGISTIDATALLDSNAPNVINAVARTVFPTSAVQGVTAVTLNPSGDPAVYAVSRSGPDITGMVLLCRSDTSKPNACNTTNPDDPNTPLPRDLSLVPGEQIKSSAFLPSGNDIRGFLQSGDRGYVLHRNTPESSGSANPEALVEIDRRPNLSTGSDQPSNQTTRSMEICSGATNMQFQQTGRGKLLFITCYEGGQIYVVDTEAFVPRMPPIEAGHGPTALTFSPTEPVAFVADYADNDVAVIDLRPGSPTEYKVIQRIGFPHTVTQ